MIEIIQKTLPQRQEHIKQLRASGTSQYQIQLFFQAKMQKFPVFSVDIGFPCYRLSNGRTKDSQLEVIASKNLPEDFFTADPDSDPALKEQDSILRQMLSEADLLDTFKRVQQDQPLILDNEGYIVNGNRRLCTMRLLLMEDEKTYKYFEHVQVIFLPPCTDRDIKELEGRLQVQPDIRADYSWTAEAMLYRDWRNLGWTDKQIADLYQKKPKETRELIAMLEDAEFYLESRNKKGRYSIVKKHEYAFSQLQKSRSKCGDDEPRKQLLTNVSYLLLDNPESAGERLYKIIPYAQKYLDSIAKSIEKEFESQPSKTHKENNELDIFGQSVESKYQGISAILANTENLSKARDVIHDTIEEMRDLEKVQKDASFCFREIQQAYTKLQSALSTLDDKADTTGINEIINNIEQTVNDIRDWLNNGNNQN